MDLIMAFGERKDSYINTLGANYLKFPLTPIQIMAEDPKVARYSDVEDAKKTLEGQAFHKTQQEFLGSKTLTTEKRTNSISITHEAEHLTKRSVVVGSVGPKQLMEGLADSLVGARDEEFIQLFVQANSPTNQTVWTGSPICSNDHRVPNNSSLRIDNLMPDTPLSYESLQEAVLMSSYFRISTNKSIGAFKDPVLLHGATNKTIAEQITDCVYEPFTNNNTKNTTYKMRSLQLENLHPNFQDYWWIVDMAQMNIANNNGRGIIHAYYWMDQIFADHTQKSFGIPENWLAHSHDKFNVFDPLWIVMCPATSNLAGNVDPSII